MANYLQIDNDTVNEELNIPTELEYYLSEAQIIDLIKTGSLDAWMDALDFAPVGVLDLMKDLSVSVPLTDTRKIQALQTKTGFNVELAIKNNRLDKETEEVVAKSAPQRRVKPAAAKSERRTTSKYKIVE